MRVFVILLFALFCRTSLAQKNNETIFHVDFTFLTEAYFTFDNVDSYVNGIEVSDVLSVSVISTSPYQLNVLPTVSSFIGRQGNTIPLSVLEFREETSWIKLKNKGVNVFRASSTIKKNGTRNQTAYNDCLYPETQEMKPCRTHFVDVAARVGFEMMEDIYDLEITYEISLP